MSVGNRLKEERKRLSMNQTQLAKIGNVSKRTQINYESGRRAPNSNYLNAIADSGVDIQYIITGNRGKLSG